MAPLDEVHDFRRHDADCRRCLFLCAACLCGLRRCEGFGKGKGENDAARQRSSYGLVDEATQKRQGKRKTSKRWVGDKNGFVWGGAGLAQASAKRVDSTNNNRSCVLRRDSMHVFVCRGLARNARKKERKNKKHEEEEEEETTRRLAEKGKYRVVMTQPNTQTPTKHQQQQQ